MNPIQDSTSAEIHQKWSPVHSPEANRYSCQLCTSNKLENSHYSLSKDCGVRKLSSIEIRQTLDKTRSCPTCVGIHESSDQCITLSPNMSPQGCKKGCTHNSKALHYQACKHKDSQPSVTDCELSVSFTAPLVEEVLFHSTVLGIQYASGSMMSLISKSTLDKLPRNTYQMGVTSNTEIRSYFVGSEQTVITTAVQLFINVYMLNLNAIDKELLNISAFSFPSPAKWEEVLKTPTISYSGRISICLGVDNIHVFPTEIERDESGVSLFKSFLSNQLGVWGPINSSDAIFPRSADNSISVIKSTAKTFSHHSFHTQNI